MEVLSLYIYFFLQTNSNSWNIIIIIQYCIVEFFMCFWENLKKKKTEFIHFIVNADGVRNKIKSGEFNFVSG